MKIFVALLLLVSAYARTDEGIEYGDTLCSAPTCEYFFSFERHVSMMYTADDGTPHQADSDALGRVFVVLDPTQPDVRTFIPKEDFISHGLIFLDGFQRVVHAINKRVPGPTIEVFQDTELIIHFINLNDGAQGMGIHWHGMYQTGTPWMDGVGGITQCHINPGTTWTYKYRADPWGSFWWHSHSGFNRDDGIFGHLVIHEKMIPDQIPEFQHDHFFVHITEWWHDEAEEHWLKHKQQEQTATGLGLDEPDLIWDAALIGNNQIAMGQWWTRVGTTVLGTGDNTNNFNDENDIRSGFGFNTFNVIEGDTYRFRFIGAGMNLISRMSVDQHEWQLISMDGFDIEPVPCESILILPGERYDTIMTFDQLADNYWFRLDSPGATYDFNGLHHETRAVVHYTTGPDIVNPWEDIESRRDVCTVQTPCRIGNCFQFEYFPPAMIDGTNELIQSEGVGFGNGAVTECHHTGDNINIDGYDAARTLQFETIGNDRTYVDVGLPTQTFPDAIHFVNFGTDEMLNGIKFRPNSEPLLFSDVIPDPDNICPTDSNGDQFCPPKDCWCTHLIEVFWNSVTDFVWFNMRKDVTQCGDNPCDPDTVFDQLAADPLACGSPVTQTECASDTTHPIHLHGHAFWVLFEGKAKLDDVGNPINNPFIECLDDICFEPRYRGNKFPPLNFFDPPQKDTMPTCPGCFIHLRIKANNPGSWPNHCHLENHTPHMMIEVHENHSDDFTDPKNYDVNRPPTLPSCRNFDVDADNGIGPINPTIIPGETMVPVGDPRLDRFEAVDSGPNPLLPAVFILAGLTLVFLAGFLYSCSRLQVASKPGRKNTEMVTGQYKELQANA